jgi:hypothetical protein
MQRLFTPLGETWQRSWYHSRTRYCKQLDSTACFTGFDSTQEDLIRCEKIGKYFKDIQKTFESAGNVSSDTVKRYVEEQKSK